MSIAWRGIVAVLLLLAAAALRAQEGEPVSDEVVRDREFGVSARHFGLERRVAMYQWRARDGGYERVWSETPIDSGGYAPGHDNPAFPLRGRRWLATQVTLDDKPLDRSVIEQFGQWRAFRPNFSALPGNLSATFQPEGDGLGSAENPLDPQIGDLRIGWRELTLPPLQGRVVLERGTWFPIAGDPLMPLASTQAPVATGPATWSMPRLTLLFAGLHALLLLALSAQVSRIRYRVKSGLGDGTNNELARWIRVQGNFVEYVPMALLLLALLEVSGAPPAWILAGGSALLVGRLLHAWGLSRHAGTSIGRFTGTALTWGVLFAAAVAAVWRAMA
ncbi:MAPEG family protein [Lysobacter sp. KIS68-7]|uniref:TMEM43 family protein n=1 Tax=Lysobacter sp. KIS68-7 TaxID=2904252 RepID=UPI001E37FA0D|nr:TMEM43 family protein [Lysobacter sp. KIS68-7]UHQ19493.1 MAPEG family protein [Lysobacter sp. KIS68-7]